MSPKAGRFYAILDASYVSGDNWEDKAKGLLEGGADLLQVRAKEASEAQAGRLLERILRLARPFSTRLILNDHVRLAASFPGVGAHIGQDDLSVEKARGILGPDRWLGLSTHSPEQARAALAKAADLNYFVTGPVFPTGTKPDYRPVGLKLVEEVASWLPELLWFCIGGIHRGNAREVLQAGGRNLVAVSDPLLDEDTAAAVREFKALLAEDRPQPDA